MDRPRFRPHLRVEAIRGEGIVLVSETQQVILPDPLYAELAPHLDGRNSVDAIVDVMPRHASTQVRQALDELERRTLLAEGGGDEHPSAAFWASCDVDPNLASARLAAAAVSLEAVGTIAVPRFIEVLRAVGIRVTPGAPRQVVLTDDYQQGALHDYNRAALASEREWLLIRPIGCVLWLGPLFRPGHTACWECLAERLSGNRDLEHFLASRDPDVVRRAIPHPATPATEQIAAAVAAHAVATWLACDAAPALEGTVVTLDLRSWRSRTHRVVARPQCRACGDLPDVPAQVARPLRLERRPKTFVLDGGHRTRTPEATFERFRHHVSPISGAVSTLEHNGIQSEGILHAYVAGANVSRPPATLAMIGDGLRARTGGKGTSDAQARTSALCEALERYSGVFQGDEPRRQARLADLGDAAIHPNRCMGFSPQQYREREAWNARGETMQAVPLPFDEGRAIAWTPVWSLTRAETRYLPTGFCFYDYPALPEAAYCIACSNGSAAGNTLEEAILQGFLELVERDSVALWWYSRARRPRLALDSFDEPYVRRVAAYLSERARDLTLLDLTSDLSIAVFAAVSRRPDASPEQIVFGFGAHLDPRIALLRAVTELNQMLANVLWGEAHPGVPDGGGSEPSVREWLATATLREHPYLAADEAAPPRGATDFARCWSDDLRDDVLYCQRLAERHGMEMLVLDQTRPDIGLPVVKVVVPGLRHFWPRFAPGRLYDVPVALGWIPAPLSESQLNPVAMFL